MKLHNQIGKPVEFAARGKTYKWVGHGSCEVPEELFEHIQLEGLPIGAEPASVSPKHVHQDGTGNAELEALRLKLSESEKRVAELDARPVPDVDAIEAKLAAAEATIAELEKKLAATETKPAKTTGRRTRK